MGPALTYFTRAGSLFCDYDYDYDVAELIWVVDECGLGAPRAELGWLTAWLGFAVDARSNPW